VLPQPCLCTSTKYWFCYVDITECVLWKFQVIIC